MKYFIYFMIGASALYFSACSSSTYNSRYDRPKDNKESENTKSVRFTSSEEYNSIYNDEFDEKPVENVPVDVEKFKQRYDDLAADADLSGRDKLLLDIVHYLQTPYLYGGNSKEGIDCSAFTQYVFSHALNINLPRTASQQFNIGDKIKHEEDLKFGDLVFFDTRRAVYPGHVGIYLGDDLFAHASRSRGVSVSSLKNNYYSEKFVGGRRNGNLFR